MSDAIFPPASHFAVGDLPQFQLHTMHASTAIPRALDFNDLIICLSSPLYFEFFEGSPSPSHVFIPGVWHTLFFNKCLN